GDALDGEDLGAVMAERERQAGIDAAPIDQHRARTALPAVAPLLGAREMQPLAQEIEQGHARIVERDLPPDAVDGQADRVGHAVIRSVLWSRAAGVRRCGRSSGSQAAVCRDIWRNPPLL